MPTHNFCTTDELAAELGDPNLRVIDASWHLPPTGRYGASEFRQAHIPGAVFFDIDTIADTESGLPHMLPKPEALAKEMGLLGLGDGMRFVIYDALGLFAAARVWWTLRAYGVKEVFILEGGLPKWVHEGRPLESGDAHPRPRVFTPRLDESFVASLDEVREALATGSAQVVDARPADRFCGEAPEPRPGLKSGHMPGSLNLPFVDIVEHGRLKSPEALKATFAEHKIDLMKPIITSCGSGVSAAILALAVEEAGGKVEGLYDGSWAEWGGRDDCPVATGRA
ncbi:MAG: 3-mercaptopyruvate sulfurtransferase [Hyphomicrobiales bacterium]|nr:3-mercaptopyruvate sulfurtransferase [Hyphomicrobiales bacterium]MBV8440250.1 3-mercaptopyruvate sulfurtransferase [Hyphomicrobiales bacterium]